LDSRAECVRLGRGSWFRLSKKVNRSIATTAATFQTIVSKKIAIVKCRAEKGHRVDLSAGSSFATMTYSLEHDGQFWEPGRNWRKRSHFVHKVLRIMSERDLQANAP
jgi:hypothetical protein